MPCAKLRFVVQLQFIPMSSSSIETPTALQIQPIAVMRSPYREKFGVPRQPGLVTAAQGYLQLLPGYDRPEAFDGLEGFSHLWLTFGFHLCEGQWRPRVRPPRLGGNKELGVFATRSPFRPNNLGLSVVEHGGLYQAGDELRLRVSGMDLVDGTPIYDIKPYVPYTDSVAEAEGGFAIAAPEADMSVSFLPETERFLHALGEGAALKALISQTLALDPRPAYRRDHNDSRQYGMQLLDYDVRWTVHEGTAQVEVIEPIR